MYYDNILSLIGTTPLLHLKPATGYQIFAKAEFLNPGGSIKDRVALHMIEKAELRGDLKKGMTIVEPTSGNTGIGLALAGVRKGYDVIIVMPENMSEERKKIIKALGAKLILTDAKESLAGSIKKAEEIAASKEGVFIPQQFKNKDNPEIHYLSTAREIYEQLNGHVDVFVSGLGSGGTLQGCARYLREKNPMIKIVAVEPKNVSALLGHEPGLHSIQGIGDGFVPDVLDPSLINEVIEVTDEEAINTTRMLAATMGLMCGTSSGANVFAAMKLAKRYHDSLYIATILADRMERYFSTNLL